MATQQEIANQIVRQLRVLDPSVSAEVGTPERKLIDTFSQAMADSQVDLTVLTQALDLDKKVGDDLDRFLSIFGFARQKGTYATGVVEFSRDTPSNADVVLQSGIQLSSGISDGGVSRALFMTTTQAVLPAGELVVEVPVRSLQIGAINNLPANALNTIVGDTKVVGITGVTNPLPTIGGQDVESDDAYKVRFRNTVFRNLAGTEDQFLALAVSTTFTTKANIVGPVSRYREYVQVPFVDDASYYDVDGQGPAESGNGAAGEYTTALSIVPYSEHTYTTSPSFVSNGATGVTEVFYTEDVDFQVNTNGDRKFRGDAYRLYSTGKGDDPRLADNRPSVTFENVYAGDDDTVEAIRPGDIVLFEHSYVSSASRNDVSRNVLNCVDVYIDGGGLSPARTVVQRPNSGVNAFIDSSTNKLHFENFRRVGEPEHRPVLGNVFTPLFWSPLEDVPEQIITDDGTTYLKNIHYWPVTDITDQGGSVRARTGVEWSISVNGKGSADDNTFVGPEDFTGPKIINSPSSAIEIADYTYDRSVVDLQVALEGAKQVTTDVLAHKARKVYLKLDLTVMYDAGAGQGGVNLSIRRALQNFFNSQRLGGIIQLSDLLQVVHNTAGVDNVRWSRDLNSNRNKITETAIDGNPRLGGIIDRTVIGSTSPAVQETQQFYITGEPTGGTYRLKWQNSYTSPIAWNAGAGGIESAIEAVVPVTYLGGAGLPSSPSRFQFIGSGPQPTIEVLSDLSGGPRVHNEDFYLKDSELPTLAETAQDGDTLPGLILRPRAQQTWTES